MYFGSASGAIDHFSRLQFRCPQFVNPADYFIDVSVENFNARNGLLNNRNRLMESAEVHDTVDLIDSWRGSEAATSLDLVIEKHAEVRPRIASNSHSLFHCV